IYYRVPGFLASLALLFDAGVVFATFKVVPVTLTLAGITGFILSVGMAVDANVLIFERFKEEVRAGRTIPAAVDAAVRRAWPAIWNSNVSTIFTSLILAGVGPNAVKGFAITLLIGVLASLISSIIVTHNLLAIVMAGGRLRRPFLMGVDRVRSTRGREGRHAEHRAFGGRRGRGGARRRARRGPHHAKAGNGPGKRETPD